MSVKNFFNSYEREVGEMLMINSIELALLHEAHQVGKLHGDHAVRLKKNFHPLNKIIQLRHMGEHIITDYQIGLHAITGKISSSFLTKKHNFCGYSFFQRRFRNICGWFYTQYKDAPGIKIMEQISVVAGEFNDQILPVQAKPRRRHVNIVFGVLQPTVRIRREVRIVPENRLGTFKLLCLNQETIGADEDPQRVKGLHLVQLGWIQIGIRQRRHSEVDKKVL